MTNLLRLFDKTLLDVFNKDMKLPLFNFLFPLITRMAEVFGILPLCVGLFIFEKKKGKRTVCLLVLAYLLSRATAITLKYLTHRPRPYLVYLDLNLLGGTVPFSSFPSAHAVLVSAFAFVLGSKYEDWQWLFLIAVILVSISRMYMGLHYPSDVIAGIIIGLAIGYFTLWLEKTYNRSRRREAK